MVKEVKEYETLSKEVEILGKEVEILNGYRSLYHFVDFMGQKSSRNSIRNYVKKHNIKKVIIYGSGALGRVVADAFREIEDCTVIGAMDRGRNIAYGFETFFSMDEVKNVEYDLIVISLLGYLEEVENDLRNHGIEKFCFALELADEQGRKELYEDDLSI